MKTLIRITKWVLHKWWLWLLLAFLYSCKTQYVPVETVKNDSIYITQVRCDSIYVKDSVYVREKADTIFITRTQWKFRDRVVRDTLRVLKCDTVYIGEPVVKEVEMKLSYWEGVAMKIGFGVLFAIPIMIALYLLYLKFLK